MSSKITPLLVIALSALIFFANINSYPLRNWDEAWYAQITKNMATGTYSFLVPYWNGQYYFDKPPLYFWLSLPFFKIFGLGQWQARIVSALSAAFASSLVYLTSKKLFGQKAGILSTLIFLTLGQVVARFAHGNLDALLVFLILVSFYFYINCQKNKRFAFLSGIAIGLAILTKGWLPAMYSFLLIFAYSTVTDKKLPKNLTLIIFGTFVASFWYFFAGFIKFGKQFTDWYIFTPDAGLAKSPFSSFSLSYFKDLVRDIGFWWIFVIFALFPKLKHTQRVILNLFTLSILEGIQNLTRPRGRLRIVPDNREMRIVFAFTLSAILFILPLNFLSEKLGWYNLPTYPFVSIIIGLLTAKLFEKKHKITLALLIPILLAQVFNVVRIENMYPDRSEIGADLGRIAKDLIPPDEKIILDDKDFTSFLYYSNHQMVYVSLPQGGKDWEWWIIRYENLDNFIRQTPIWLITQNSEILPERPNQQVMKEYQGYKLVRYN